MNTGGTKVVNKHQHTLIPGDVYIGRGSRWGNDFSHYEGTKAQFVVGSREEAISEHRKALWAQIKSGEVQLDALAALHGRTLVCFCAPKPCHGHTLAKAAAWAFGELQALEANWAEKNREQLEREAAHAEGETNCMDVVPDPDCNCQRCERENAAFVAELEAEGFGV